MTYLWEYMITTIRAADIALMIMLCLLALSLYLAHKNKNGLKQFSLFDLIMENGRVSRIAFAFMATLFVSSWVIIQLAVDGKLTEGYFGAYCLTWVAPIITRIMNPAPPASISESKKETLITGSKKETAT